MEAEPHSSEDQEPYQAALPDKPQDKRALALVRLAQSAQERNSPHTLLPLYRPPGPAEMVAVRATAVGRGAERDAERNAVLAGDPKCLVYYVMID